MIAARRSLIGFIGILLIIGVIGISAFLSGRLFIETNTAVTDTLEIQLTLSELLTLVVDAETGGRGFFITADETYLDPYTTALEKLDPSFARLQAMIEDPQTKQRLLILRDLIDRRLTSLARIIDRRRIMSFEEAQAANTTPGVGKVQMDEIRRLVGDMQARQETLLNERNAAAQNTANVTSMIYTGLTVLAAALLSATYILLQRSFAESKRTEAALEQRVAERTRHVQFLADASAILAEPAAYQQKLNQLAQMTVNNFADIFVMYFPQDADSPTPQLEAAVAAHRDPAKMAALTKQVAEQKPGPDSAGGIYEVFKTGKHIAYRDIAAMADSADTPGQVGFARMRDMGLSSIIIVPLNASGKRLGVLSLSMETAGRIYTDADVTMADELADRAAMLIDNGRLFTRIQQLNADLELRVTERTQQLEAINKELEAFNYSVSHDLRAPLRSIDGFSQALVEDYGATLPPAAGNYLNRVRAAAQRMGELIDDLLGLSRLTRVDMQVTNVNITALAQGIAAQLRESTPAREITVDIAEGLRTKGDSHLITILLENLIGNAWKFTGKTQNARIEVGQTTVDGQVTFFVRDNGAGFDMAYIDRLFGAFERLHSMNEFEGTGIGLAIVQRVVNRHGGKVWAEGKVGEGATFYFQFSQGSI